MDLDLLKTIRETVDWVIEKFKNSNRSKTNEQLNKIANQISTVAKNNAIYIAALKSGIEAGKEDVDLRNIQAALRTAKTDTDKLQKLLEEFNFDSKNITFNLKHGLETLTSLKRIKIQELRKMIADNTVGVDEQQKVIRELESFEQKWKELGEEMDGKFSTK